MTRPITITERVYVGRNTTPTGYEYHDRGSAAFHQFGSELFEQEGESVSYTIAVIEWPDGKVDKVPVEWCKFTDTGGTE